jgi:hypothetical protein
MKTRYSRLRSQCEQSSDYGILEYAKVSSMSIVLQDAECWWLYALTLLYVRYYRARMKHCRFVDLSSDRSMIDEGVEKISLSQVT